MVSVVKPLPFADILSGSAAISKVSLNLCIKSVALLLAAYGPICIDPIHTLAEKLMHGIEPFGKDRQHDVEVIHEKGGKGGALDSSFNPWKVRFGD